PVADDDAGGDKAVLAENALLADRHIAHDVAEVPNLGVRANLAGLVNAGGMVDEHGGKRKSESGKRKMTNVAAVGNRGIGWGSDRENAKKAGGRSVRICRQPSFSFCLISHFRPFALSRSSAAQAKASTTNH
ncbi:MAG: hypothetical protein PHN77_22850, partial [Thermoguttaceae bacterium]|nr:hypothetical protein [Thermoguttaceae bacterium]